MSEALRLANKHAKWSSVDCMDAASELRRLTGVEAELQQAREERTALLVNEQNLREELATCRELLAEIRASLDKPIAQQETMPMREKEELVMGWFAEDWAISKGLDMLHDYEKLRGMK
jgi:hypothetical protein